MKQGIYLILLSLLLPIALFSKGSTEESDYKQASGKENWEHEVAIQDKKPGKYNLLIRVKDKANNESFSGPFDIHVDPESDIPLVSITNPSSFMRVGGVLNIVGTARDDDSIKKVMLKINDGDYFEAVGQEFWSYTLDADILKDGQHTITAKAVDINGLEGHEVSVIYNQDTIKPVNSVENYSNGAVFSGKVTINGKVVDANGIAKLEVSTDNQKSYSPVDFDKESDEDFYTFELDIDTKKLVDGPNIYWFKSLDKTGSVGYTAFLFFVDNMGPITKVIDPVVTDKLNGKVSVSGTISDVIGVKSFKYRYNEKEVLIPLLPGNPYWSQTFDLINEPGNNATVVFISEDTSGNIAELEYEIPLNKEADKPVLTIINPVSNQKYKENLLIEGYINDDDYVDGFSYQIDGGESKFIKTFNSFSHNIEGLSSGKHILTMQAKDSDGVLGDIVEIPFEIESYKPQVLINSVSKDGKESLYYPGIEVTTDGKYKLLGSVTTGNSLTALSYNINGGDYIEAKWRAGSSKSISLFEIDVDNSFNYGALNIGIKAVDNYGNEVVKESLLYVTNYTVINDKWGLYNILPPKNESIKLSQNNPFKAFFNGPSIKSVSVIPNSNAVKVSFKDNVITVSPGSVGETGPVKIVADTDKGLFETKEFNFISDSDKPIITLTSPEVGYNAVTSLSIAGTIDEFNLDKLTYRLSNESEYKELRWSGSKGSFVFKLSLAVNEILDESLSVEVVAVDKLGNTTSAVRSFKLKNNSYAETLTKEEIDGNTGKGSDKPTLFVNFPSQNQILFTEPVLSGFTRDDDSVKEIKITDSSSGKSKSVKVKDLFDISLKEFGEGKKELTAVAIDVNGTESKATKVLYNYVTKRSGIKLNKIVESVGKSNYEFGSLISSEKGVLLEGSIIGLAEGEVSYSFSDTYTKAKLNKDQFSIPVPENLGWGQNHLSIVFTDIYGRVTSLKTFFYIVDKLDKKAVIDKEGIYFNDSRFFDDYIDISGKNPLIGLFNGRDIRDIYLEAETGALPEFLSVINKNNTIEISSKGTGFSGNVRAVVTTIDGDIYRSNYLRFISDSDKPELNITTLNNQFLKSSVLLEGSIKDNNSIKTLTYSLDSGKTWTNLDNTAVNGSKELKFSKLIDLTIKPDGGYTVLIKGEDLNSNTVTKSISFIKDGTDPKISLFIPGVDEVNGKISLIGKSSDNIELDNISYSNDGAEFVEVGKKGVFSFLVDFGEYEVFPETFVLRATDRSGNYTDLFPEININQEKDKPVVQIQTPIDGEVIRNDFVISGMAFDDDGVDKIFYSLDGGEMVEVAKGANNFSLNIPLDSVSNNDHIITVKAVDILGVESDIVTSTFWVSKEEPTSQLLLPKIEETKRDTITLKGTSFDKNGIESVYISTDNGVSYQKAIGQENWTYTFNTKNIKDGTYSIFIKAYDKLDTEGFYSTLMNIDNTAPELIINEPFDGDILSDKIVFSGRSLDNIGLKDVKYKIYSHTGASAGKNVVGEGAISGGGIFNIDIPLDDYSVGEYNIELIAYDLADNRSISTRNFSVTESENAGDLEILFPQAGSTQTSLFEVSGKVLGRKPVSSVECYIDDELFSNIKVNEFNFFNLKIDTLRLAEGEHTLKLKATLPDGQIYETDYRNFFVKNSGAWLNIVNMKTGDNISGRPFLVGEAGFIQPETTDKDDLIKPVLVEVSLDNGQIFIPAKGRANWEFRVETWQYKDGLTPILVRAKFSNGDVVTSKVAVNIDRTKPDVGILENLEEGRFNESIGISGTASDKNGLTDISVVLREGSKSKYEIPGVFQGMFIDVETSGGKLIGGGLGLTFFDDNVKLQFTAGETRTGSDSARIKGPYLGGKLIANIHTLEFGRFFGPDWDFFSMSLGVGASFTQKTITIGEGDDRLWFSSVIGQLEFAKVKFNNDYFSSSSLYVEYEATLLSAENAGGFIQHIGIGTRLTLF